MRRYFLSLFFLLAITSFKALGQTFVHIDLTGSPNSSQTYTGSRTTSSYCGDSNCIVFVVTLNPGADLLNITSGQLAASDKYTVNCGPQTPVGTPVCITGGSNSDTIAFCKPGNNSITYTITSSTAVKASGGTTLRQLCNGTLSVTGLTAASATWTSISPGAPGTYNGYLSCTQCTTTTVTPAVGAPASILYKVSGLTSCANSRFDTVRIYTVPPLAVTISPATASICNGTPVTLTANITGGNPAYTYSWSSGQTTSSISTATPGTYTVSVSDNTTGCPAVSQSITVTTSPTPTVTSAASATICNSTAQNYAITSSVAGTTYSWGRAAVAGISNAAVSGQTSSTITESLTNTTSAPVNVVYAITPTASGCPGPVFNYTVTVNPTPTVTSAASAAICNSTAQNYSITSNVTGTTFSWGRAAVAGISNAAVSNQTSSTITESLVNTTNAPVAVTYIITPTANGCSGPAFTYTVTVNPTPTVTSVASAIICNSTAQNYAITGNVSGTTYNWGRAVVAGISNAAVSNQTSSTITENLTNTTNAPVAVTYVITPTANGCSGPAFTYTVTVNPTPAVTSAASTTICNSTAQNYTITGSVTGTTFSWGRAAVAGISNPAVSAQTSSTIIETLVNTTNAPVAVTYVITPSANGCSGPAFNYVVTVNPTPTVTSAASATICNSTAQNYTITGSVTGTTYSWGRAAVAGISNAAVSAQTSSTITESLTNTTSAPVNVAYIITPSANGCSGPAFTYTVTVNPTPTVTSAASAIICNSTAQSYAITSNVTGTTFSWGRAAVAGISNAAVSGQTSSTITENLTNTTSAPVNVAYIITPSANGCSGPAFTYTVTVNPTPTVTSAASTTICNSTAQNYPITSNVSGATFSWGRAAVAGISNAAVSNQTSNTITETLVNTTNAPVAVAYIITPSANGCSGPAFTYTVTVNPTPTVTSAASAAICNSTMQNYTITGSITGTTFSWGRAAVAGISNAAVSNQASSTITESLVNTTSAPVAVTYIIVPTANGCSGPAFNYVVTVNPTPTVTSAASAAICNSTAQNYAITGNVTGTTFSWGRAAVAGISNAAVSGQTSSTITESLTNTTSAPVAVTYVITPTANGCSGPTFNYVITVNPTPTVTSAASAAICNSTAQNYAITGNVTGTTFSWGRAAVAGISNAAVSGQTSSTITESLTNTTSAPVNVTYIITLIANGCSGPAFNYVLTVNPTPTVTSAASATICNSTAQNYTITGSVTGTTFSWGRAAVAGISNAAVSNQAGSSITETLVNTTNAPVAVTYVITPTANGCSGPAFNYIVTVNPTPTVTSAASAAICNNSPQNYIITSNVAGTAFSWGRATVAGISNAAVSNQASSSITETLVNTTNAPVNVTYVITPTANGCSGPAFNYVVTVNPTPTVTSAASATVCNNTAQNYAITSNVSGTTFSWGRAAVAGISNAAVSGQTSSTITESLINTTSAPVNVVYAITPTASGCPGPVFNYTVTVNPTPTVTSAVSAAICNSTAQNYAITSNVTGTTFSWGRAAVAGISNAAVAGQTSSTITESLANTTSVPVNVTYVITPTANGCSGPAFTYTVTVNPTPTVTSAASAAICNSTAQNYAITSNVTGTTFSWGRAAVAGISNAAVSNQTSSSITESLVNTTNAPVPVIYVITPSANGCSGPAFNYTVTVNPTPTVTSAASATICNSTAQNYIITGSVTGTTFSWGRAAVAGISNAAVSNQTSSTITETLVNTTNAPIAVTYVITPSANGCSGLAFTYTVTINPTPTVTSAASAAICNSTAQNYTITSNVTGTTFSWGRAAVAGISNAAVSNQTSSTITETLVNTTSAPVNVTYVIIPSANGCSGPAFNRVVTVNPTPTVTSAASAVICNSTAQNYTITSNVTGATFSWGRAAVAGISNAAVSGQTAGTITETLVNTTNAPVAVTYIITPTANGCSGPAFTYTVTVNPTPTVTSAASATTCNNSPQNYTITASVTGTTFSWGRAAVAGINNAAVSGQTASSITETLVNTTNAPVAVTYIIIPTANGCSGPAFNYVVTVNPTPTVTSAASATICNSIAQNYAITSNVTGATFSWGRAAVTGISNAAVSGQTSSTITESLTNTTSAPVNVTYIITPIANGCSGPAFTYTVTVNPTPTVTSAASATICNSTAQNYAITSNVSGATFSWGRAAVAGISNAAVSNQTSSSITETLVNTANAPVAVTYVITPSANGCSGPAFTYTVTVNPTPTVTSAASATICNNSPQNYIITSNVTGTAFSWGRAAVAGISNAAVSNQTSSSITETLVNTTLAPVNVTYIITPSANGCSGPAFNYVLTVNPTPTVTSAASATICNKDAQNYIITGSISGTTFLWSRSAVPGINNAAVSNQTSNPITEVLNNITNNPVTVTYAITPIANGCAGPVFNYTVTVNPTADPAFFYSSGTFCKTGTNPTPTIVNPSGGTFSSSAGLVFIDTHTGQIDLSASALGTYTITFVTNTTCSYSSSASITITNSPDATFSYNGPYCQKQTNPLPTFPPGSSGGVFSSPDPGLVFQNPSTGEINLQQSLPGTYTVTNNIAASGGCAATSATNTVTINPAATVDAGPDQTVCSGQVVTLQGTIGGGATSATWSGGMGTFSNASSLNTTYTPAPGETNVTLYLTTNDPAGPCGSAQAQLTITINPTPAVTSASSATICSGDAQNYTITSNVAGTTFTWSRPAATGISNAAVSGQTGNPITETLVNTTSAPVNAVYTIIPQANGCTGAPFNYTVTVNPTPTVTSAASATICNSTPQNYTITSNVTGTTFTWGRAAVTGIGNAAVSGRTGNTITESLTNTTNAPIAVTYTIIPQGSGCPGPSFNYVVTVNPTPTVTSAATGTICNNTAQSYAITSDVTGTIFSWSRTAVTGISNAAVSGQSSSTIAESLNNTTATAINVTYTIIPEANGCTGPSFNYTVTVNPTPLVTSAASAAICNNTAQSYTITSNVNGTIYNWSRPVVAGISNAPVNAQAGDLITESLTNTTSAPVAVTYVIIPTANGCAGSAFNYTVTVDPTPIVTSAAAGTICNNTAQNYAITSNVAGTTFTWSRQAVNGISNPTVNGQTSSTITEILLNATTTPVTVTYVITPQGNGCPGPAFNYVVTVNPTPTVTSAASVILCNNIAQNYMITGNVSGTTYNWSRAAVAGISNAAVSGQTGSTITETLVNTTNAPVAVTYVITPTANGCSGPAFNYVVTVNPTPTVTSAASATICNNSRQNYIITSNVTGTSFSWGRAAVAGISNAAVSNQTSSSITETLVNTTNAPVNVTYVITPTANGCSGPAFNYVLTVNPTPTVTSAASATICNSTAQNYAITSNVTGATFSWGRAAVAGISNAAVSNQTSGTITESLVNTTSAPVAVTYVITPTANGCSGPAFTYTVTVKPTPTVTSAANAAICNSTAQNYSITSNVSGTTFSWGRAAVAGISNIAVSGQTSSTITESLINTTSAPVNVTYVITPLANGCSGPAFNYVITVNPTPTVTSTASATICNSTAQNYAITSNVSGTTFSWGRAAVAGISNGTVSSQTSSTITESLVNTTSAPVNVTYVITPTANGCSGPAFNRVVTVNPTPTVTSAATATICNSTAQNYSITSNVTGTTFLWGRAAVAGISNAAVSNQAGSSITETLVNTTNAPVAVTYVITPTANGCSGPAFNYTVTVNPTPIITNAVLTQTVCSEGNSTPVTLTSNVTGAGITWTAAATAGITGFVTSGTNVIPAQTLLNAGTTTGTVTYTIKPSYNGCDGVITTYTIQIPPKPATPVLTSNSPVCSGTTLLLSTAAVAGATYNWTGPNGFSSTLQNPQINNVSLAFQGNYNLTITVNGCTSNAGTTAVIINQTPAAPIATSNSPICAGSTLNLAANTIAGAIYSWTGPNGFTSNQQNPVILNAQTTASGTYSVTVTLNGCPSAAGTVTARVNPIPVPPVLTSNSPVCEGSALNLKASNVAGATYTWTGPNGFTSNQQNPVIPAAKVTDSGTYVVTVVVNGCSAQSSIRTSINQEIINPVASSNSPVCSTYPIQLNATTYVGASYKWTGPNGFTSNQQNPVINNAALSNGGRYSVVVTSAACFVVGTSFTDVTVNQTPLAPAATSNSPICAGQPLQLFASNVNGGAYSWTGPNGFTSSQQNPVIANAPLENAGKYSVTVTVNSCTSAVATTMVVIDKPAVVSAGSDQTVCANNATVSLNGTVTGGSTTGVWSTGGSGTFTAGKSSLIGTYIPSAADAAKGTVKLTLTAANTGACLNSASITIIITPVPVVSAGRDVQVCSNEVITLNGTVDNATGGRWASSGTGTFTPSNTALNAVYTPSIKDQADRKVTFTLTSTGNGTCLPVSSTMTATILPAPVIDSMALQYVLQKGTIVLKPTVTGTNLQYLWTPNLYLNNNTLKNPTFTGVGDIIYTLTVTDAAGCTTSAQLPIKVLKPIIIPNTFTPNGDGVNDTWVIDELHNYPGATVRIFDRYGMQLLYSEGYGKPWDGTYKGKPVPYGVYYYLIDIKPWGKPLSGFITVIR